MISAPMYGEFSWEPNQPLNAQGTDVHNIFVLGLLNAIRWKLDPKQAHELDLETPSQCARSWACCPLEDAQNW